MPNSQLYDQKLQKLIASYIKKIQAIYHNAIVEVSLQSTLVKFKGKEFTLDLYPAIKKKIDEILSKMSGQIQATVFSSISDAWNLSSQKNDALVSDFTDQMKLTNEIKKIVFNPNYGALKSFIDRTEKGLNLSKRVFNLVQPYKFELEAGLKDGIGRGEPAAKIASTLKRYLNEPDKLFRRVMDKNGKLQLSKAARAYNPGQGLYRSSFKNALRLTATETNISYRKSDNTRWQQLDFVKGIEIKLSASHTYLKRGGKICMCEICEIFAGEYPKDFVFTGWHPFCKCFQISILTSKTDFSKLMDFKYGRSGKPINIEQVTKLPAAFTNFIKDNKERIKGWANKPYWANDNSGYVGKLLK